MNLRRDVFQAIADPTRRSILILLATQTMTAGAIAEKFNTARPTISKHIQILTQCGLVDATQQGREIHYRLRLDKLNEVDVWVEQIKKIWEQRFDDLDKYIEQIQSKAK